MSLTQATWNSVDVVYAQLALDVGVRQLRRHGLPDGDHLAARHERRRAAVPARGRLLRPSRRRHRRAGRGRDAAGDGRRLRHARRRWRPPPDDVDRQGRLPRRPGRPAGRRAGHPRLTPGQAYQVTRTSRARSRAAPAPGSPRSAAGPRRARPAPPTTSPTPGSSDTRRAFDRGLDRAPAVTGLHRLRRSDLRAGLARVHGGGAGPRVPGLRHARPPAGARAAPRRPHRLRAGADAPTGAKDR